MLTDRPKNTNLVEDVEDLLLDKSRQNPFIGCRGEVEKCVSKSEARAAIYVDGSTRKKRTNLVEDVEDLLLDKSRQNPFSGCREVEKCVSQSEARAAIFVDRLAQTTQTW